MDSLEQRLQAWIEKSIHLFRPSDVENRLGQELIKAMRRASQMEEGVWIAPSHYLIHVNSEDLESGAYSLTLEKSLVRLLIETAHEAGIIFSDGMPTVEFLAEQSIGPNQMRVEIEQNQSRLNSTAAIYVPEDGEEISDSRPENAFLIIEGSQTFPLRLPIVNIGRRSDNHLVIDDPRVSRSHAQLRAVRGRYVLLDINATGGTYVNGQRITQLSLNPGDVISLAGVAIIYGEDVPLTNIESNHEKDGDTKSLSESSPSSQDES